MHPLVEARCLTHGFPLTSKEAGPNAKSPGLTCPQGCVVPVVRGVPRFVSSARYASSFGLQWKAFGKTQLDSQTRTSISRDRLTRCLGGSLDAVEGKLVLEAGCGAGRFTELLLSAGARVFACDLSDAVEANYENCSGWSDYFVCQADLLQVPVAPASFDVVLCLGVIQHTPSPEATISALVTYVKPGGLLVIDHYGPHHPQNAVSRVLRALLTRLPPVVSNVTVLWLARMLLPLHRMLWRDHWRVARLRHLLRRVSPLADYYDSYPELGPNLLGEWAVLDAHDALTDRYKHFRTVENIRACRTTCGLSEIEVSPGGNGIEARARRPLANPTPQLAVRGGAR